MYISAYTDIDVIVISYTIVHTQHNTWRKKIYNILDLLNRVAKNGGTNQGFYGKKSYN